jgi:DNA-binding NarL/FixJ family response regulator
VTRQKIVIGCTEADRSSSLARALRAAFCLAIVTEAVTPELALAAGRDPDSAVLVLDGYPASRSLRALADLACARPGLQVLVLGPLEPNLHALVALASGATGYLPSHSTTSAVANAVDALLRGDVVLPQALMSQLVQQLRCGARGISVGGHDGRTTELTNREWDVLVQLRQARRTDEIAERLVVSNGTVRSHVKALLHKLGEVNRAALLASANLSGSPQDRRST